MLVSCFKELVKKNNLYTYEIGVQYQGDIQREYGGDVEVETQYDVGITATCSFHKIVLKFQEEEGYYYLTGIECDQDSPEYEPRHLEESAKEKMAIYSIVCAFADRAIAVAK